MRLLQVGSIVEVDRGFYRHLGLFYGWRGQTPMILVNLPSGTKVQSLDEFSNGQSVYVKGYPSNLLDWQVLTRAKSVINKPYSWLSWNCEHFVNFAHGLKVESPQVLSWAALASTIGLALVVIRS